jgi:hypothetical protein
MDGEVAGLVSGWLLARALPADVPLGTHKALWGGLSLRIGNADSRRKTLESLKHDEMVKDESPPSLSEMTSL